MSRKPPVITKVDVTEFEFTLSNMSVDRTINIPVYHGGSTLTSTARVVRVFTDEGVIGEYIAHRKLRELIKTPILQLEHLRGLEPHVDFVLADGTDFVRVDQDYDGGITGAMKIAHAAEGFGLDVEPHAPGPSRRQCLAAVRNANYYELGLVHPRVRPFHAPVYTSGYSDEIGAIDGHGNVAVPELPGLGVTLDWPYIEAHRTGRVVYD